MCCLCSMPLFVFVVDVVGGGALVALCVVLLGLLLLMLGAVLGACACC